MLAEALAFRVLRYIANEVVHLELNAKAPSLFERGVEEEIL
jgi:hypothetical protein